MKRSAQNTIARLLVSASLCLWFLWPAKPQTTRSSDIALLVHPDTPVDNLSLADVRKVFLGERQYWTAKLPVELYLRAPVSHERGVVLRVIYQMSEAQYRQYWIAKILRAEAVSPPKTVFSQYTAPRGLSSGLSAHVVF